MTHILAISGSLRAASTNTALLRTAASLVPAGVTLTLTSIADLPLYNGDLDDPARLAPIERLKAEVTAADAVVIATPEYNYGIPGPLKNAIDWASRPAYRSPFAGKPVGVMGAAGSFVGTARAQAHLKNVLLGMGSQVFPHPELLVGRSFEKVADGLVTDDKTREVLARYLADFAVWVARVA